jgi:hypothetical protein
LDFDDFGGVRKQDSQRVTKPFAIDKRAAAAILSVIDGAFSIRMLYGNSKEVPILSPAEAVLKSFQSARAQRRR